MIQVIRYAIAVALLSGAPRLVVSQDQTGSSRRARTVYEDLQMLTGVLNQIRVNHPDSTEAHKLIMAAIRGMVSAADPHSYVIPYQPLPPELEREWRDGKLLPVGITFAYVGGAPVVVSVAPGSSAARNDILPGDELVAIERAPVRAESADELAISLSGRRGTSVRLAFERQRSDGSIARVERTVAREKVGESTPVPVAFMLDSVTGYVRVTTFESERAAEELHNALVRLDRMRMRQLLLDLRDNGGGQVKEAAAVAGEFLPSGAVVYSSAGRKAEVGDTVRVSRSFWNRERKYPVVVLVNEGTASASELVAGALQDHDRALIAGRTTFGKSLMMQPFPLPDGSVLMMVIGHIKTPCGRVIQRQYRDITARDYYRRTSTARDSVDRPSCRTTSGRTVFGGGGIVPDVVFGDWAPSPPWLSKVSEELIPLKWVGGWLQSNGSALPSLEGFAAKPSLPGAVEDFRRFVVREGVTIPSGAEVDALLERYLARIVADAKWGDQGLYRLLATHDPDVQAALGLFERAATLIR